MKTLIESWRRWRADAPKRRLRRAIAGVRRQSKSMGERPFSDKYDGDGQTNDAVAGRGGRR